MNKTMIGSLLCFCSLLASCIQKEQNMSGNALIEKYAIRTDGKTLTTRNLQQAIDDCAGKGGGVVSLPPGQYLTGTLVLKKNVTLHLEKGATLLGSRNIADYPASGRRKALLFAEKASNISITGQGEINGNGDAFNKGNDAPDRPTLILLLDCNQVNVKEVKLTNSGFWTFRFVRCDGVDIRKIYIEGHANWNNDGLDIESRNVTISDCVIDTDDDAICFKSEDPAYVVENITVKNCNLSSNCNYIKFGTASAGGFRNIRISDCILHKCSKSLFRFWEKKLPGVTNPITGIAGIALEVVDGGFMEDITVSNLTMTDVQTPVFVRLGKRKTSDRSYLKNILIKNITATSVSHIASSITGVPGLPVENVEIRHVDFQLKGGGKAADTQVNVPEAETAYPENRMFGTMLPAYGFYIRHAANIRLTDMKLSTVGEKEERHAIVAEDVDGLTIARSTLQLPAGDLCRISLDSCRNVNVASSPDSEPLIFPGNVMGTRIY
ncbi:glycoside hydrolase family 28 protein [Parabacteroides pacaensis]|uniref:glycoside hydrolase family 28 protein n=1 Tax=Parabacteroides pacaensis TaxID=2086575 RepID=UPI000D0EB964|nr:glycosyl hydrolase family 28 protein [Parabacteroides pacaensis]